MDAEVSKFLDPFDEIGNDAQRFAFFSRAIELQKEACEKLEKLKREIVELKKRVVAKADNDSANLLLGLFSAPSSLSEELEVVSKFI